MDNEEKILELLLKMDNRITKMDERLTQEIVQVKVTLENEIIPSIQWLKEGQKTIQNQIKHISVIDSMQDDIATLKSAVKFLSQEIDKLQKAM